MDKINPSHYKNGIETIDAIEAHLSDKEMVGYLKGQVLKYMMRAGKKTGVSAEEDYQKANWYLQRLLNIKEEDGYDLSSVILNNSPGKHFT